MPTRSSGTRTVAWTQETTFRAAVVQMDVTLGDVRGNLARVMERLEEAAANQAKVIVYPEAALSGYCFTSLDEAMPYAVESWNEAIWPFATRCEELGIVGVLGFLASSGEPSEETGQIECGNWALLAGAGRPGSCFYAKTHLPVLGADKFVTPGDGYFAWDTPYGNIGALICYDIRFPEAARCLGLMGADIIALPTNWPDGAESSPDFLTRARAWENRVYVLAANRVGVERGRRFIGRSQIVAPSGEVLCEAGADEETILYADLNLAQARQKRIVIEPGEWELDTFGGRRPELYGKLTETS
jgi:predicted amidohydrolase